MSEEEDWVRREMHRVAGFAAICRSKGYKACILMLGSESLTEYLGREDPARLVALLNLAHPSPMDRSLSKRSWEKAVQDWRRELRRLSEFSM